MKRQQGFGVVAAIAVLVLLASLAGGMVFYATNQGVTSAIGVMAARAWQAAKSGSEWGLYQALRGSWQTCNGDSSTLDMQAEAGVNVTVTCQSNLYNEGETAPGVARELRVFEIRAVACSAATCPATGDAAAAATYVERSRLVIATSD